MAENEFPSICTANAKKNESFIKLLVTYPDLFGIKGFVVVVV
jgi:hypothetical protein